MPNTTETNAATTAGAVAALKNAASAEVTKVEAEAKSVWSKIKPYVIYAGIALVSGAIGHFV